MKNIGLPLNIYLQRFHTVTNEAFIVKQLTGSLVGNFSNLDNCWAQHTMDLIQSGGGVYVWRTHTAGNLFASRCPSSRSR